MSLAAPQSLLGLFLFADITDKTGKYSMPVPDLLSEGNLQRELFTILPHADQFSSLPVDMPLASRQVTLEPSLVKLSHEFRHECGQGSPDQFGRIITKDPLGGGISEQDESSLVRGYHGITRCFDDYAIALLAAFLLAQVERKSYTLVAACFKRSTSDEYGHTAAIFPEKLFLIC